MEKYAIVVDGTVTNIAIAENAVESNWVVIPAGINPSVGDAWDGIKFTSTSDGFLVPTLPVTDITVTGSRKVGNIHWVGKDSAFTMTAKLTLDADADLMFMVEKIVKRNGVITVVDDTRFVVNIVDSIATMSGIFTETGNWRLTAERLNEGLLEIGALFRLSFDPIEFDVHV